MGDRTSAQVIIGGDLHCDLVDDFCGAAEAAGMSLDWDAQRLTPDRLLTWLRAEGGGTLTLNGAEINYGEPTELIDFLTEHKLPHILEWDAGGGFGAGGRAVVPGADAVEYTIGAIGEGPSVSTAALRQLAKDAGDADAWPAINAYLETLEPTLPPFRVLNLKAYPVMRKVNAARGG